MNDNEKLAYLAGMIDGEGSITIFLSKFNHKFHCLETMLSITNNCKEGLEFCNTIINGKIRLRTNKTFEIKITNQRKIKSVLEKIYPYLIIKKQQASVMLEYIKSRERKQRGYNQIEIELANKIRNLNRIYNSHKNVIITPELLSCSSELTKHQLVSLIVPSGRGLNK
jgi:hypothetical protein